VTDGREDGNFDKVSIGDDFYSKKIIEKKPDEKKKKQRMSYCTMPAFPVENPSNRVKYFTDG